MGENSKTVKDLDNTQTVLRSIALKQVRACVFVLQQNCRLPWTVRCVTAAVNTRALLATQTAVAVLLASRCLPQTVPVSVRNNLLHSCPVLKPLMMVL